MLAHDMAQVADAEHYFAHSLAPQELELMVDKRLAVYIDHGLGQRGGDRANRVPSPPARIATGTSAMSVI